MSRLKNYLLINAAFSLISGICMLLFYKSISAWFSITNEYVLPAIGLNLIVFSFIVWLVARKYIQKKGFVSLITILDLLWVAGSFVIIAFQLFNLSNVGYWCIGAVAIFVAFLAYKQFKNN